MGYPDPARPGPAIETARTLLAETLEILLKEYFPRAEDLKDR